MASKPLSEDIIKLFTDVFRFILPNVNPDNKEELAPGELGINYDTGWRDFHFMRYCKDNKWHTKNGSLSERIYQDDIFSPWKRIFDDYQYDSEVVFLKYRKGSNKNAEPLY